MSNKSQASKKVLLALSRNKKDLHSLDISFANLEKVVVGFHPIDIEILFSKSPFSINADQLVAHVIPKA